MLVYNREKSSNQYCGRSCIYETFSLQTQPSVKLSSGSKRPLNVIRQVLGFHAMKEGVSKLQNNKFSLIIDETTDKSTTSQLAILAVYFNEQTFKLEIILVDLIPLSNGAAATIYKALLDSLKERDIPMKNVVGFCADTCNMMFGANHSVAQMLVKDHPWVCPSQSVPVI